MSQFHTFTVDGFSLTGVDEYGVLWTTSIADGWHDAPPMRTSRSPKAQRAGTNPAKGVPDERVIRFGGLARGPSPVALEAAARRLAAVLASGGEGQLIGSSAYGVLSAQVSLDDDVSTFRPISSKVARWRLTVAAPDPLLYGPPVYRTATLSAATPGAGRVWPRVWPTDWGIAPGTTPGALSLPNAGTAAYWPRLRIDGPVLNPVVTCVETGAWVRYSGALVAGQWLDWDMANRRILLQGQVSVRRMVSAGGDWLAVPIGGATIPWTADTADPAALLSAWGYEMAVG